MAPPFSAPPAATPSWSGASSRLERRRRFRTAAAGRARTNPTPSWMLTTEEGKTHRFRDSQTLQKWVVERRVTRADRVCPPGGTWRRLGDVDELRPFFDVVAQADRAAAAARRRAPDAAGDAARLGAASRTVRVGRSRRRRHSHRRQDAAARSVSGSFQRRHLDRRRSGAGRARPPSHGPQAAHRRRGGARGARRLPRLQRDRRASPSRERGRRRRRAPCRRRAAAAGAAPRRPRRPRRGARRRRSRPRPPRRPRPSRRRACACGRRARPRPAPAAAPPRRAAGEPAPTPTPPRRTSVAAGADAAPEELRAPDRRAPTTRSRTARRPRRRSSTTRRSSCSRAASRQSPGRPMCCSTSRSRSPRSTRSSGRSRMRAVVRAGAVRPRRGLSPRGGAGAGDRRVQALSRGLARAAPTRRPRARQIRELESQAPAPAPSRRAESPPPAPAPTEPPRTVAVRSDRAQLAGRQSRPRADRPSCRRSRPTRRPARFPRPRPANAGGASAIDDGCASR